jgi:integrase
MPISVVTRRQTGALTLSGSVKLKDGTIIRVQRRAASDKLALAREEAAVLEADILRADWHGERRDAQLHTLDEAIVKYLEAKQRSPGTAIRLERLREAIGGSTALCDISQDTITDQRSGRWKGAAEATILREVITPLRAVLQIAAKRKWCDLPDFETPATVEGRTAYCLPSQAERLILAAAPNLKPLATFLFCNGPRLSEALYLDWQEVDLVGGRVILWADRTKAKKRRDVLMPPRSITALAALPHREGAVFRRADGEPYAETGGLWGGQIRKAWGTACARAGLSADITPHIARHSWASWHYALYLDPKKLRVEGGWHSLEQVDRYAHLLPGGHAQAIRDFLGLTTEQQRAAV